jgi:hypothetical protein
MLRIIVFLAALALAVPTMSQPLKPTGQQDARRSQRDAKLANVPPTPITNNQATIYYEQPRENKPQGWHKFFAWPEGITVWAIMLTLGAIIWQAWETRKAAQAARDGIRLQETAYYQWLELVNWRNDLSVVRGTIRVNLDILNPTDYPLTLKSVNIKFGLDGKRESHLVCKDQRVPPKNPIDMYLDVAVNEEQEPAFFHDSYSFPIVFSAVFVDVLGKTVSQVITGAVICGSEKTSFVHTVNSETLTANEK